MRSIKNHPYIETTYYLKIGVERLNVNPYIGKRSRNLVGNEGKNRAMKYRLLI